MVSVQHCLHDYPVNIVTISDKDQDTQKKQFIKQLDPKICIAIGNGRNDVSMLKEAAISIGLIQKEGCHPQIIQSCSILSTSIKDALSLVLNPKRIKATLRNE